MLETGIATPIVAGDLAAWIGEVEHSWSDAAQQIHYHAIHLHPRQYEEIAEQDPELLPRIDTMKADDVAIEQRRDKLSQEATRHAQHVPRLEPDEEKAMKFTKSLVEEATMFIVRVRKQAVAVQTWYVEAFNRDRGVVD